MFILQRKEGKILNAKKAHKISIVSFRSDYFSSGEEYLFGFSKTYLKIIISNAFVYFVLWLIVIFGAFPNYTFCSKILVRFAAITNA